MSENRNHDSAQPGPEPERLKIDGDWKDAVKKSLGKKRPKDGWPSRKPDKGQGGKKPAKG